MIKKKLPPSPAVTVLLLITATGQASEPEQLYDLNIYATMRPTLAHIDGPSTSNDDNTTIDIRDYNSFAGVKAGIDIGNGLRAIFQGEWKIDISDTADFGDSRRGYVGLQWLSHRVALGKQRPPQYLLIGQHIDISNNEYSPFGYVQLGPFFVDNMVTYRYTHSDLRMLAAARFNGREGNDKQDLFNTGVSYQINNIYIAGSFLQTTNPGVVDSNAEGEKDTRYALAISTTIGNTYLALAYQDIDTELDPTVHDDKVSGSIVDIVAAHAFGDGYKAKLGLFYFDDGRNKIDTEQYQGFSITLERQLHKSFYVHVDYLSREFAEQDNFNAVAVGMRYDLNITF